MNLVEFTPKILMARDNLKLRADDNGFILPSKTSFYKMYFMQPECGGIYRVHFLYGWFKLSIISTQFWLEVHSLGKAQFS